MSAATNSGFYTPHANGQRQLQHHQQHKKAASDNGHMAASAQKANAALAQAYAATAAHSQTAPSGHPVLQAAPSGAAAAASQMGQLHFPVIQQPNLAHVQQISNLAFHMLAAGPYQGSLSIKLDNGSFVTLTITPPTQQN